MLQDRKHPVGDWQFLTLKYGRKQESSCVPLRTHLWLPSRCRITQINSHTHSTAYILCIMLPCRKLQVSTGNEHMIVPHAVSGSRGSNMHSHVKSASTQRQSTTGLVCSLSHFPDACHAHHMSDVSAGITNCNRDCPFTSW